MTTNPARAARPASALAAAAAPLRAVALLFLTAWRTLRQRYEQQLAAERLMAMTDAQLKDIGLYRSDIPAAVAGRLDSRLGRRWPGHWRTTLDL